MEEGAQVPYFGGLSSIVQQTEPVNGAENVARDTEIKILFTLDMIPETISASTIVLLDDSATRVPVQVYYSQKMATIKPDSQLNPGTRYQLIIKGGQTGVKSLTNSVLGADYSINFTASVDQVLGKVQMVAPSNLSLVGVVPTFSWQSVDGAIAYEFEISKENKFASLVFQSEVAVSFLIPDVVLENDQIYYWRVRAVDAVSSGPWSEPWQFRFNAYLGESPAFIAVSSVFDVVRVLPAPESIANAVGSTIQVVFNQEISKASLTLGVVDIKVESMDGVGEPVAVVGTVSSENSVLTFTPSSSLAQNSTYRITISKEITSSAGIALDDDITWIFSTVFSPYYSSVSRIRDDLGGFVSDVNDITIAKTIYNVSLWADQITAYEYGTTNSDYLGDIQSETTNKIFFHEYARYETDLRILSRRMAEHMGQHGMSRQLGDLIVKQPGSMSEDLTATISYLQGERDKYKRYLTIGDGTYTYTFPASIVMGSNANPYPLNSRLF
jgi:hypothetical protein